MITLENIEKSFSGKKVLRNINLKLNPGKIYGILGKNFSGKTTLLKIISGQLKSDSGDLLFNEEKIYEKPKILENISLVREEGIGIDDLKVKKMMELAKIAYKNWDDNFKELLIKEFNIDIEQRYYKLTREKQTLVSMIIGIASRADWTLFDEPTLGISKTNLAKFCEIIRRDLIEYPRTIIISNNCVDCTSNLFDEVIIMKNGKIILNEDMNALKDKLYYASGRKSIIDVQMEKNIIFKEEFGETTVLGIYDEISTMEKYSYEEKYIDISKMPFNRAYNYFTEGYSESEPEEEPIVSLAMYGDEKEESIELSKIIEDNKETIKTIKSEVNQVITNEYGEETIKTISKDITVKNEKEEIEVNETIKEEQEIVEEKEKGEENV